MLKKILLTVTVILLVFVVVRWKQKRQRQNPQPAVAAGYDKSFRIAAAALLVIMLTSVAYWAVTTL